MHPFGCKLISVSRQIITGGKHDIRKILNFFIIVTSFVRLIDFPYAIIISYPLTIVNISFSTVGLNGIYFLLPAYILAKYTLTEEKE